LGMIQSRIKSGRVLCPTFSNPEKYSLNPGTYQIMQIEYRTERLP
jgi:hypothetical protein